jgi:hypothetical protein
MSELTVIVPVRTGDERIAVTWPLLQEWIRGKGAELLVMVDDQGKGYGVKQGIMRADGQFCAILDVDLPVALSKITEALGILKHPTFHFHFVQGKRVVRTEPLHRRFLSWGFHELVKHHTGVELDTQCGFQVWRTDSAKELLPYVPSNGWTFPVLFYMLAESMGMSTYEMPVNYQYDPRSTMNLFKDSWKMLKDLMNL